MEEFLAQQFDCSPVGISGNSAILRKNTVDDIKTAVKNNPTQINSWLIFRKADVGDKILPIMYVNINENKWIDL